MRFLGSSKNLSEHLSEEVNWLFCRRLSALSLPPPPLLTGAPTQSTQGNVVNFCYDRLRDNPTIAKHFVYLSHSHKSSRILKAEKEKAKIFWTGLVVFRSQRCDSAPHWQHPALTLDRSISILIAKSAPVIKPDTPQNTEPQKLFANSDFSAIQRRKLG